MSQIKLPKIKVMTRNEKILKHTNNNQHSLSSLINSSNSNNDIFLYSKLYFDNRFQTKTPSFKLSINNKLLNSKTRIVLNKNYSYNICSSSFNSKRNLQYNSNNNSYIVDEKKVPDIYQMHSKIIKNNILKKINSLTKQSKDNNDNDKVNNINIITCIDKRNKKNNSELFNNPYSYKQGIDKQIKNTIDEEVYKAKIKLKLMNRSIDNSNRDSNRTDKLIINNQNDNKRRKINLKKINNSPKETKWIFITREMMKQSKVKTVEISKYSSPYSIIENEKLMKRIFAKNLSYIHLFDKQQI